MCIEGSHWKLLLKTAQKNLPDMTLEDKDMADGFNAGYVIEKHQPELSQKLVKAIKDMDTPFNKGFVAGAEEYSKERTIQSKAIDLMRDDRSFEMPELDQEKTKTKNDKNKEPDIEI